MNNKNNIQAQSEVKSHLYSKHNTNTKQIYLQKTQKNTNNRKSTLMIGAENESNPMTVDFYSQMGRLPKKRGSALSKNSNLANSRGNSNKKNSQMPSGISNQTQLISASMGALPGLQNALIGNHHQIESVSSMAKCESQTVLPKDQIQTAQPIRRMQTQGYPVQTMTMVKSKSKQMLYMDSLQPEKVLKTNITPVKARNLQITAVGAPGRVSVVNLNQKSQNRLGKSDKQGSGKHTRQHATTNIAAAGGDKQAAEHSQKNSYGQLSKQQLKLMKQLEKQQTQHVPVVGSRNHQTNTQATKFEGSNTKNVIDNYFKVNQQEGTKAQPVKGFQVTTHVVKTQMKPKQLHFTSDVNQKKRLSNVSSPNKYAQHLQRYISNKNAGTKNTTPTAAQMMNSNINKYRSSLVEALQSQNCELAAHERKSVNPRKSGDMLNLKLAPEKMHEKAKLSASPSQKAKRQRDSKAFNQGIQIAGATGNVVIPNLKLFTMDYQNKNMESAQPNQKLTTQPINEISSESLIDHKQDDHLSQIQRPLDENKKTKFQKFQSVKSQHSSIAFMYSDNLSKNSINQRKISNYNTKVKIGNSQNDYSDSKSNYNNHATLSHLSSSQLEQKQSVTQNETGFHKLQNKLTTTNIESNIFNDDNTNFTMPAQSQRTRVSINKLSISADKTSKPQNKDLLKSTIELGANNFSQIQADKTVAGVYSCIENNITKVGQHKQQSQNTVNFSNQISKQSIDQRDIKLFKVQKQEWKLPKGIYPEHDNLITHQQSNDNLLKDTFQMKPVRKSKADVLVQGLMSKSNHGSVVTKVTRKPRKKSSDTQVSTVALKDRRKLTQQQTLQHSADMGSNSECNEVEQDRQILKPVNTLTYQKAFDYKQLILENNQKIINFQQQTPTGSQLPQTMKNATRQMPKQGLQQLNFIQSQLKQPKTGYFTKQ